MRTHRRTFIKQLGFGAAALGLMPGLPGCCTSSRHLHMSHLPRSTPEEQGVQSPAIVGFLDAAAESKHEFHSFMMARHGNVIAEGWWTPYRASANHMLYSLSKSFTSTSVGFAVSEGRLTVEDPVLKFFPDEAPPESNQSEHLRALRVKDLLTMSVGRAHDSMPIISREPNWAKAFLAAPIEHPPGSVFLYDSGATYMLSAIVTKVTGQKVMDYLRPRLFGPLDIHGMTWEVSPQGVNTGGWGLAVPTEALVKFGQFYLQEGVWKGRQLLPASWIHEATTFKIQQPAGPGKDLEQLKQTSDWHQGYCYQFWRCRHNGFRGDGAYGQFMVVLPDRETVVAITCQTGDMQGELNLVWDHILPGIQDASLPPDADANAQLKDKLARLALQMAKGRPDSATAAAISGRTYQLESNDEGAQRVTFQFPQTDTCVFTVDDSNGSHPVRCGIGRWIDGVCTVPGTPPKLTVGNLLPCKVAASAAWKGDQALEMLWRYYETPHHDSILCHFDGPSVTIEFLQTLPGSKGTRHVWKGRQTA
ncbi:MAG TPA: serine hydrolase [Candidatus Saccharimonadales bacterium]|nr:serine hydrolase [Candidatus Saccharimonadales bacterium]